MTYLVGVSVSLQISVMGDVIVVVVVVMSVLFSGLHRYWAGKSTEVFFRVLSCGDHSEKY